MPQHQTVNPYEYYSAYQDPYSTQEAYGDIGLTPTQEFLGTADPTTGRTYQELIPEYDPYAEEEMRTQFTQGAASAYQSSIGQLAGVTSRVRGQQAKAGFAGAGAGMETTQRAGGQLRKGYGEAFQGALLDLVSGIRGQRTGYQEQLASLLEAYGAQAPEGVSVFETGDTGDTGDDDVFPIPPGAEGDPDWNPPYNPYGGQSYTYGDITYYWNPLEGWQSE
jgi:hypothetical protein